jgi:dTDP-4-dehydrorhamnose 3,5-epimerase
MSIKITETELEGVLIIEPDYFYDNRGYYCETFSERSLKEKGFICPRFVQDNQSFTLKKGTVRGIHFQINPKPQSKLVRCTRGKVFDVVVDLRKDSPTFKKWFGVELSEENKKQLWIPNWCGHAFMTLEDNVVFQYKVDELYYKEYDRAIQFDDKDIGIVWPILNPTKSQKDIDAPYLKDSDVNFLYKDIK